MIESKTLVLPSSIIGRYQVARIGINQNQKLRIVEIRVAGIIVSTTFAEVAWDNDVVAQLPTMLYNPDYVFESVVDGPGTLGVDVVVVQASGNPVAIVVMYEIL